mgnify:CR=1 FL=1
MLEVRDLQVAYGQAPALWGVSFELRKRELLCVVGPNGAGKTTLINTLAGVLRATPGSGGRIDTADHGRSGLRAASAGPGVRTHAVGGGGGRGRAGDLPGRHEFCAPDGGGDRGPGE